MELLLYAVVKFVAYSLWGYVGFRVVNLQPTAGKSVRFGIARWLLGVGFGVLVFLLAGSVNRDQIFFLYLSIYIPVRIVEWTIMPVVFFWTSAKKWQLPVIYLWIAGGVLLSFLTDFVSPDMLNEGRFCVGRCLC